MTNERATGRDVSADELVRRAHGFDWSQIADLRIVRILGLDRVREIGEEAARAASALNRGDPCPCGHPLCEGQAAPHDQRVYGRVVVDGREIVGVAVPDPRQAFVGDEDQNA